MAIFRSTIFDVIKNKLANTVMYKRASLGIMRSNPGTVRNPRTPAQLTQRAKMKFLADLSRRMAPIITVGMQPSATRQSVYNAFVSANMPLAEVDENYDITLIPKEIICSEGVLKKPEVTAVLDSATSKITITLIKQQIIGLCAKDDNVYAGFFETNQKEAILLKIGERVEETSVEFALPQDWLSENLCIYTFAISKSKRNASPTRYLELS